MSLSDEFKAWLSAKTRCHNPNARNYRNYGARGIKVCDEWRHDFERFYADMGPRPSKQHSLDRIDNDGPYAPGNCRWANHIEQHRNTRRNVVLEFNGERLTVAEWSERLNIGPNTIHQRLRMGWSAERALSKQPHYRRLITVGGETKSVSEWARFKGVKPSAISARLYRGWPEEMAVNGPESPHN